MQILSEFLLWLFDWAFDGLGAPDEGKWNGSREMPRAVKPKVILPSVGRCGRWRR